MEYLFHYLGGCIAAATALECWIGLSLLSACEYVIGTICPLEELNRHTIYGGWGHHPPPACVLEPHRTALYLRRVLTSGVTSLDLMLNDYYY